MSTQHILVHAPPDRFCAWPANNGLWAWADGEILTGCVEGSFDPAAPFHRIQPPFRHALLRSLDGGLNWRAEYPSPFVGDRPSRALEAPLDFTQPDLALRVVGTGYHGSEEARGAFLASYDRGRSWQGPYPLNGLEREPQLSGLLLTPRTDVLVEGPMSARFLLSARPGERFDDRTFCARTVDGGLSFQFVSWITPGGDPHRAVMPATVRMEYGGLVTTLRRREVPADRCWIDAYASADSGQSWRFLSRVGETGDHNGNPPALARLRDGRLACVYGRRDLRQLIARLSADGGRSWGVERILRADFTGDEPDFGYPRLLQRPDGRLLAVYYWASAAQPLQHIAATLWEP